MISTRTWPPLLALGVGCTTPATEPVPPLPDEVCTVEALLLGIEELDALASRGCTSIEGDLAVLGFNGWNWRPITFDRLRSISGVLSVRLGGPGPGPSRIEMPELVDVGSVEFEMDTRTVLALGALESLEVLDVQGNGPIEAPQLVTVRRATLAVPDVDLPSLASVDTLRVHAPTSLPALTSANTIETTAPLALSSLRTVGTLEALSTVLELPVLETATSIEARAVDAPRLTHIDHVRLLDAADASLPTLATAGIVELELSGGGGATLPALTRADGLSVFAPGGGELGLPVLADLGILHVDADAPIVLPALTSVMGVDAQVRTGSLTAPLLQVSGPLGVSGASVALPSLHTAGDVSIAVDAGIDLPMLESVGPMHLEAPPTASVSLPSLVQPLRLELFGGASLGLHPDATFRALSLYEYRGAIDVTLVPDAELLWLGYVTDDSVDVAGGQHTERIVLETSPAVSSLSAPDVSTIGTLKVQGMSLDTLDLPSLSSVIDCVGVEAGNVPPAALLAIEAGAQAGGASIFPQAWQCP
ncbi:MAG: hypothetical protein R3F61_10380 [Myxococcota bacterium]